MPTDRLLRLTDGDVTADIVPEAGGRLGQVCVGGRPLLRGPEHAAAGWVQWGSYPLLPWPNRVPGGVIDFEGERMRMPVDWPDGSAIHGLAADRAWEVEHAGGHVAELVVEIDLGRYHLIGRQSFALAGDLLEHRVCVTNVAAWRVPVGLGVHPWFVAGPVCVPAAAVWPGDGPLPTGPPVPVDATNDLRTARLAPVMDRCYTGLTATSAAIGDVELSWSGPVRHVVVYTGEPGWVCVEPVTMATDGFGLAARGVPGSGVIALDPGASTAVTYRYTWPGLPR